MTAETQQKDTMDKAAMMEVYCKAGAPGPAHAMLEKMAGMKLDQAKRLHIVLVVLGHRKAFARHLYRDP